MNLEEFDKLKKHLKDEGFTLEQKHSGFTKEMKFQKRIATGDKDIEIVIYGEFNYMVTEK